VVGQVEEPVLKAKAAQILLDLNSQNPARQVAIVKQALALAWGQLGEVCAMEALVELLADPTDTVRLHAIAALKNFPHAYQQLEELANNEQLTPALKQGIAIALAEWNI
jgi:HEAT repeat protein